MIAKLAVTAQTAIASCFLRIKI